MGALIRQLLYLIVAYSYEPELKGDWSLSLSGGKFVRNTSRKRCPELPTKQ
jgi:hypothetical protein